MAWRGLASKSLSTAHTAVPLLNLDIIDYTLDAAFGDLHYTMRQVGTMQFSRLVRTCPTSYVV